MTGRTVNEPPASWGSYEDAERLRKWSFLQRTPEQRLDWLIGMLELAYTTGARKPRQPAVPDAPDSD